MENSRGDSAPAVYVKFIKNGREIGWQSNLFLCFPSRQGGEYSSKA